MLVERCAGDCSPWWPWRYTMVCTGNWKFWCWRDSMLRKKKSIEQGEMCLWVYFSDFSSYVSTFGALLLFSESRDFYKESLLTRTLEILRGIKEKVFFLFLFFFNGKIVVFPKSSLETTPLLLTANLNVFVL